jgi:hypothetical protein
VAELFIVNNMSVLSEIYDGWKNLVFPSPQVEELAKKRIAICVSNECKKFRTNKSCALCGCYMPAKVRSPRSKCALNKW